MTVYADEAFLLNGAVDYLLLICAAKLGGGRIARLRLLAAALFGGLYAAAALFAPLGVLQGLAMKLVSLVIMLLIAFGAGRQTLRTGLLFLAAVCAFAGAAVLAAQLFGTGVLVLPGGTFYAVSVLGLLLLAGLLYMLCYTVFSCTAQHGGEIRTMTLLYGGNRVPVRALHDTGCTLRDPMTGERVLVADADALRALLPDASITPAALADPACRRPVPRPGGAAAAPENTRPRASGAAFELQMRRHAGRPDFVPALRDTGQAGRPETLPRGLFPNARFRRRKL